MLDANKLKADILDDMRVELSDEFDRNFERKAFFSDKWKPRAHDYPKGSLLVVTSAMRRSAQGEVSGDGVRFSSALPYTTLHNEGGTGFKQVRAHTRKSKKGKIYTVRAHQRKFKMPQRQFIGDGPDTQRIIRNVIDDNLKKIQFIINEFHQGQMRKQIFKAIAEAVAAVPDVAFVDLWNNQVQTLNGGAAFPFAAVFIEFEAVEWKQQNMGTRRGALAVRLHVVTRSIATHGHKDPRIDDALAVFDLLDNINNAMQGLRGDNFSGFMLTTSATNHDHAEIVENVERYVCGVQDITAMRPVRAVSGLSVAIGKRD